MKDNVKEKIDNFKSFVKKELKELNNDKNNFFNNKNKKFLRIFLTFLTSSRIISPPIILLLFISSSPLLISFILGFAITDALDGFIARKYNLNSKFGAKLDAAGDKIFAATCLGVLALSSPPLLGLAFLTSLGLEAAIASTNMKGKKEGLDVKTNIMGKIKTVFLFTTLVIGFSTDIAKTILNILEPLSNSFINLGMPTDTAANFISSTHNSFNNFINNTQALSNVLIGATTTTLITQIMALKEYKKDYKFIKQIESLENKERINSVIENENTSSKSKINNIKINFGTIKTIIRHKKSKHPTTEYSINEYIAQKTLTKKI